ncbi:carboxylesterase [Burkholderia sp. Leaf177]|nr:carboxylesterase [Burkholderia sp. Leaf177]
MIEGKPLSLEGGDHSVLLLHGLSSSPLEMRFLARALHREGFTVAAPVLSGYSAGTIEQRMEAWVAAAVEEFDALSRRYAHVSVCGLSIGAALALALAVKRPSAQSVILLSVTLDYDGWAIPWYRFLLGWAYFTPLRSRWRYREQAPFGLRNEALRSKVARAMLKGDLSEVGPATISLPALHEASRLARKVRRDLQDVRMDCLIVHAIDDETSSPTNARFVSSHVASTFLRAIYLDDSYHMITSDNERETVAREVVMFLRESEAAASAGEGSKPPVVSKALARRLRQIAALAK